MTLTGISMSIVVFTFTVIWYDTYKPLKPADCSFSRMFVCVREKCVFVFIHRCVSNSVLVLRCLEKCHMMP